MTLEWINSLFHREEAGFHCNWKDLALGRVSPCSLVISDRSLFLGKFVLAQMIQWQKLCPHLEASQSDFKRNIQRWVDDPGNRLNEGHEEQREPDDTDQKDYNHPSHPVLHHLLLLLASRLGIPLQRVETKKTVWCIIWPACRAK